MVTANSSIAQALWNDRIDISEYISNEKYYGHILEQYKLYVEMTDRISARRGLANTFFLTLHTLLISAGSFAYDKGPSIGHRWILVFPLVAVLALCYTWWRLIKSYRQLNSAKFKVIGEIEARLLASPYWRAEWQAMGEGKDPKRYKPLTDVENWVPFIFAALYISIGVFLVLQ